VRLLDAETGRNHGTLVAIANNQALAINPNGHYRGTPRVERFLIYVAQTDHGQETFTPEEFAAKFGWKNDPDQVRLIGR
jgi:hypothetical protein